MPLEQRDPPLSGAVSRELLELAEGHDDLLADALRRLRREEQDGPSAFFHHGDHGSHNSG